MCELRQKMRQDMRIRNLSANTIQCYLRQVEAFARLMERTFRYTDDLFRFGGEEFVVLLSDTARLDARSALERFRRIIEDYAFPGVGNITLSIGFVDCSPGVLPTTLIDRADQALYFAKDHGRNQVVDFADIAAAADCDEGGSVQLF